MAEHRAERPRAGLRLGRGPLVVLSLVAALASVTSLGTYAFWNDTATVTGSSITTGTLDLEVDDADDLPSWVPFSMSDVAPGESRAAVLRLRNAGSTPFTVTATGSATGADLASVVTVRVVVGGGTTPETSYPRTETCAGGTEVYSGTLAGSPTVLPASAAVAPAVDGGSTPLCLEATLPTGAGNTLQGKTWTPTFTLIATQQ